MTLLAQIISATRQVPILPAQEAITSLDLDAKYDKALKVPGSSPVYHCSDPANDIYQITGMVFKHTNPRVRFYQDIYLTGHFTAPTGDVPWLYINGSINGREGLDAWYDSPLCDLDVFQEITVPNPRGDREPLFGLHRSCPPGIAKGYAIISTPPLPLYPFRVPVGEWKLRAEATTQKGEKFFCVQVALNITT